MIAFHVKKKSTCTLAMSTNVPMDYGVARVAEDGRVKFFEEKPILEEYPVSMGIDIVEKEVLSCCEPKTDFAQDVVPSLLSSGRTDEAYLAHKRHYDVGTFRNLEEVRALFEHGQLTLWSKDVE